ncbi:hypothetical protein [Gynurincola endophyticus]|uniref:hypothetical protein n=1 Tax=Gynurincola endophyticus TaxID=2479004 RepID=UPI000F8C6670|nr:hypothetical protein [Gynurincola endophyticus]
MRFIKLAIISFIVIAGIITAISAMIPSKVNIIRSVHLSLPKDSVIHRLSDMNDWKNWNLYISNPALTNLTASANEIRSNELTVQKTDFRNDSLITLWSQGSKKTFDGGFVFFGDERETIVQWYFTIQVKWYPWEKFSSVIYEKQIGPMMEESLNRLSGNRSVAQ